MGLEPLQVRAWLRAPVVSDDYLPLDGILLYQAKRHVLMPEAARFPGVTAESASVRVPLACHGHHAEHWYYACSFAQWSQPVAYGKDHWSKRLDTAHIGIVDLGRKSKVQIGKGRYRSYHMPVFYRSALSVHWYCVGDAEDIRELLADVWAIGKKTAQGWGRVARWEVRPWPTDWSVECKGRLMRAIPVGDGEERNAQVRLHGFRPPYWKRENQTACWMPAKA